MDLSVTLLLVLATYILIVTVRWALKRHKALQFFKRYGIPGPKPSFFAGNMYQLRKLPTPNDVISSWLKDYGNVFGYYMGETPYIVVNDLEMLKQIFIKDFHFFTNRPEMFLDASPVNKTIVALRGKRWKEVRAILTPTFSSGKIKLMTNIVHKKIDVTVNVVRKKTANNEMFDMYELVQGLTLDVIADCALAMKTNCQENLNDTFLIAARDFIRLINNRTVDVALIFPFVASVMTFIANHLTVGKMTSIIIKNVTTAIAARRNNPEIKSIDILQLMLDHNKNDDKSVRLTDQEITANAYMFLLVGYETTSTALAFTFYLLIKHPDIQERLYREIADQEDANYTTIQSMQYMDQVFRESLRYYPPVTGIVSRTCLEDHQVGSWMIPKGANVLAPVWDIHHDPKLWPDPWKFDPDRFSPENKTSLNSMAYMPFGSGPRNCIGARFAQLEAKLTIFRLVKEFRFEICEKTDDPLHLTCPSVITNPANGIYLRAVPRITLV